MAVEIKQGFLKLHNLRKENRILAVKGSAITAISETEIDGTTITISDGDKFNVSETLYEILDGISQSYKEVTSKR